LYNNPVPERAVDVVPPDLAEKSVPFDRKKV
jgi:hypothetical protein